MGRPRKDPSCPYPPRVYPKHGALYYVPKGTEDWIFLIRGLEWTKEAAGAYAKHFAAQPLFNSFAYLCELYKQSPYWDDMAPRTQGDAAEQEIPHLCKFFGRMLPRAITPMMVGEYKLGRGKKARVRCNRELSRLRAILAFGLEGGWVDYNAAAGIAPWKEKHRTRNVEKDERERFRDFALAGLEGDRVAYITMDIAYLTTQRRTSVLNIRLEDIEERRGIWFAALKGGKRVLVRWTDRLRAAVDAAKTVRPVARLSPYLICTRKGTQYTDSGIQSMWGRLQVKWKEAGNNRFTFHDSRAMGISKLKGDGRQARDISGHKTESTAEAIYDRRSYSEGDAVE